MPLFTGDGYPMGVEGFATHRLPLDKAPHGYEIEVRESFVGRVNTVHRR
jgi:hypothetical protein